MIFLIHISPCFGKMRLSTDRKTQTQIGTDIVSCISSQMIRIGFGHSFGDKWSIDTEVGLKLLSMKRTDEETQTHWDDIGRESLTETRSTFREIFQEMSLHIRYWPQKAYKGIFISVGGKIPDRYIPDICIGLGYQFPILRNTHASIAFQRGIIETMRKNTSISDGLRIGINYIF